MLGAAVSITTLKNTKVNYGVFFHGRDRNRYVIRGRRESESRSERER